jgi:tetrapyrrole methylase family protein/MazG family protein
VAKARDLRELISLVARLRAPDGCPWDQAQTHQSLTGLLIEEAYEVVEAIEANDPTALQDELGDLLLHVAFHVQMAQEADEFDLDDVLNAVYEKVIRRHPHVFGDRSTRDLVEIKARWEELKRQEERGHSTLRNKKRSALPALVEARKALDRAANLGIGIDSRAMLNGDRLSELWKKQGQEADAQSLGQLLLGIVAFARERGLEPELCLKKATARLAEQIESMAPDEKLR